MLKRPNDGGDGKRKKAKQVLAKRQPKSAKAFPIVPGMGGILVSCTLNKEKFATKEVMSLLTEYADEMFGEEKRSKRKKDDAMQESDDDEEEETIEDAFKKELEGLKSTSKLKRFHWYDIGIDCCFFVKVESPIVPVDFTLKILNDLFETKKKKTRYTLRLVPVAEICTATLESIVELANKMLPLYFKEDKPVKYSIVFNRRNSDRVSREEVIPELGKIVGANHIVDIKNPDIVILVEVIRGICGISIVPDFYKLKKFNLESIHDEEHAKRAFKLEKTGGSAGTERRKAKANHKREQEERAKNKGLGGEESEEGDEENEKGEEAEENE